MHILLLGDSLFVRREGASRPMIEACLVEKLPDLLISNSAISGLSSQGLLDQVPNLLPARPVDKVFILIGSNDLITTNRILEKDFAENLQQIIDGLLQIYQSEQIYLISPPPVDEDKQWYRHNGLVSSYANTMQIVAEGKGCSFINLYQIFLAASQTVPLPDLLEGAMDDGLHFGKMGYDLLAAAMLPNI